jgi:hypothetical protein
MQQTGSQRQKIFSAAAKLADVRCGSEDALSQRTRQL